MSAITQETISSIEDLKREGRSVEDICRFTGRTRDTIVGILDGRCIVQAPKRLDTKTALRLKSRNAVVAIVGERTGEIGGRGQSFLPSPQQIEAACLAIRETWSEEERYNRKDCTPAAVRRPIAPMLSLDDHEDSRTIGD